MKKILAIALAAAIFMAAPAARAEAAKAEASSGRGGFMGAVVGCCFGLRTVADWNEGKKIHVCEWLNFVGIGPIWAAIEGWQGTTRSQLQKEEPAYF